MGSFLPESIAFIVHILCASLISDSIFFTLFLFLLIPLFFLFHSVAYFFHMAETLFKNKIIRVCLLKKKNY